jgi:hypothetical protein
MDVAHYGNAAGRNWWLSGFISDGWAFTVFSTHMMIGLNEHRNLKHLKLVRLPRIFYKENL